MQSWAMTVFHISAIARYERQHFGLSGIFDLAVELYALRMIHAVKVSA